MDEKNKNKEIKNESNIDDIDETLKEKLFDFFDEMGVKNKIQTPPEPTENSFGDGTEEKRRLSFLSQNAIGVSETFNEHSDYAEHLCLYEHFLDELKKMYLIN